jgi:hypothetical protein
VKITRYLSVSAMAVPLVACTGQAQTSGASCVEAVDVLLDKRAEELRAKSEDLTRRFPDSPPTLEAQGEFAAFVQTVDEWENRIRVEVQRCPEAAQRVLERRREVPLRVQMNDHP